MNRDFKWRRYRGEVMLWAIPTNSPKHDCTREMATLEIGHAKPSASD
jgi:hypothetical protein